MVDNSIIVSIILCTRDRAEHLRETLQAIGQVPVPDGWRCELLVIDNASTDETPQVVQQAQLPNLIVRYLREPKPGKSHAYNLALQEAQGQVLLCTDDDVRPLGEWIQGMAAPILSGQFQALVGGVQIAPHLDRPWMKTNHRWCMGSTECVNVQHPEGMIGANMAFSREVLVRVPEFDPALGPGALGFEDDTLFSKQIMAAGYRLGAALDVVVEHHFEEARATRAGFLDRARKAGRCLAYVAYHWEHQIFSLPRLRLAKARLRLAALRWKNRRELRETDGVPLWEADAVSGVTFYQQYLEECQRPFNYTKRGLVRFGASKVVEQPAEQP